MCSTCQWLTSEPRSSLRSSPTHLRMGPGAMRWSALDTILARTRPADCTCQQLTRSFQRIHLRGKAPRVPTTRGAFKAEYGKTSVGTKVGPVSALGDAQARPPTHLFDGQHATFSTSTFQLCDITAPSLVTLIHAEGPGHLRSTPDVRARHLRRSRPAGTLRRHGKRSALPSRRVSMRC